MKNLFKRNKHRLQVVRQHDSMQCGVACLAMICGYYDSPISLETLGQQSGICPSVLKKTDYSLY